MTRMTDAEWQAKAEWWAMELGFVIHVNRDECKDEKGAISKVTLKAWAMPDKRPLFLIQESTEAEAVKNADIAVKGIAAAKAAGEMQ